MGKMVYRKQEASNIQGICVRCLSAPQTERSRGIYRPLCRPCHAGVNTKQHAYRLNKGLLCELCGFVPEHACQLDVDHKDGDHCNDDPSNLQTLCANCHRLKTYNAREHTYRRKDNG